MKRTQLNRGMKSRVMYVELKSGFADNGPAWIARVSFSKTAKTVYFHGKALQRSAGRGVAGNYFDVETGEEYWVSGIKADNSNRHWAGSGAVEIEPDARDEYLAIVGKSGGRKRAV